MAVVGYGVEGTSAVKYWQAAGYEVTVCDQNPALQLSAGVGSQLGDNYLGGLDQFDIVVRTQSIRPDRLVGARQITSTTKEFFARCPAVIIGVTGSKGKGTTATLIAKLLEAGGHKVWLAGNIGKSPLDFLGDVQRDDLVVLELSSFQLMDLDQSPQIAVCLMIVPEHMNWHPSMEEYLAAKSNIFKHQAEDDLAIYNKTNPYSTQLGEQSLGHHRPYLDPEGAYVKEDYIWYRDQQIMPVSQIGLIGPHNQQNICAAVTAIWDLVPVREAIMKTIRDFNGLEHRIEPVREVGGVRYYDDSFSTTPETAIAAIRSFQEPKVLILGGSSKDSNYDEMAEVIAGANIAKAILIGATAPAIQAALDQKGFKNYLAGPTQMTEIVKMAHDNAPAGGVVLLSPGCASYDMFKNYKDRGEQFKAAVNAL
ncbi:MAG TPA: UDP-N-acetylmuramoyl-L-alanine--D-glutamate ligase [Candidatus Saccharimonadia bacterium]|nr:UDP-N-acetylmuramoyl-L-alanine--D-glutamate ligase [Candidatus Saccharimonadia bacterium]